MNREDILKKSQQENKGRLDEMEMSAMDKAGKAGMLVGAILSIFFVVFARIFNLPEVSLASFMIYFSILGSRELVLYKYLNNRSKLIHGIICVLFAVAFLVAFIFKVVS
ncbi:MAG: DUF6442 family protein [Eubacterium sp.]|nr:DUF6442 family protein [Eubacterium sp.]